MIIRHNSVTKSAYRQPYPPDACVNSNTAVRQATLHPANGGGYILRYALTWLSNRLPCGRYHVPTPRHQNRLS